MKPELYWIEGLRRGRLAIAGRPRGGDWLEDEMKEWRRSGVDKIVSFLTPEEERDLALTEEKTLAEANGLAFVSFPIADRSVPTDRAVAGCLVRDLERELAAGKSVAVHCRQGLGRSGLMAACLLIEEGVEPKAALRRLAEARGSAVPETAEQRKWVLDFAPETVPAQP